MASRSRRGSQQLRDILESAMGVGVLLRVPRLNNDAPSPEGEMGPLLDAQLVDLFREPVEGVAEALGRPAGIDQRTDEHVSAQTADTIEVGHAHESSERSSC